MSRGKHTQSITSNGGQREDKKLLKIIQRSQLHQHGEFQNHCGPFVRAVLAKKVEEERSSKMAADGTTKALISPPSRGVSAPEL